ncbi:MAG: hypothetical protein KDD67_05305 [Ignavibacteriae bacterium]|nr:hypothetical protein [Ignavibacteriota bacterium]MCB9216257.1 hypothetical protein [Ignavibacteria bacterium]
MVPLLDRQRTTFALFDTFFNITYPVPSVGEIIYLEEEEVEMLCEENLKLNKQMQDPRRITESLMNGGSR